MTEKYNIYDWKIKDFYVSDKPEKKYYVIIEHRTNKDLKPVKLYFGAKKLEKGKWIPYQQFKDSTPLGTYKEYDHYDLQRRQRYINRHIPIELTHFTPNMLSFVYLWS